jgi:hypothetical protein
MKKVIFNLLEIIHVLVWTFVIFAFLNTKTAYFNINYLIPFIYIVHLLPFHILIKAKQNIYPKTYNKELEDTDKMLILPYYFLKLQSFLDKKCTGNPISGQGMMIFGALSSSNVLLNNINIIKKI